MTAHAAVASERWIGDVKITFIPDGSIRLPADSLYGDGVMSLDLGDELLDDAGLLVMSMGAILIESNDSLALIDLGWGPQHTDIATVTGGQRRGTIAGGDLLRNLSSLGLEPSDIDVVAISHLHGDHIGWLTSPSGPSPTFTRATHFVSEAELAHWEDPENPVRWGGPSADQLCVLRTRSQPLHDEMTLLPGLKAMATAGHTPGHFSFVVSSGQDRAIVLGDTMHCSLEIMHPHLSLVGDVDPATAHATRERLRRELDDPHTIAVAGHFSHSVFGRVVRHDSSRTYRSDAVEPSPVRAGNR